jgi:hypothetical protein
MLLSYLDAAVGKQRGNALHRDARLEQPDCELVSKTVGVPILFEWPWRAAPGSLPQPILPA